MSASPPLTTTHLNQSTTTLSKPEILKANTTDPTCTESTKDTTSPALTNTTTTTTRTGTYNLTEEHNVVTVVINSSNPTDNYNITFTSQDNEDTTTGPWTSFSIPFKKLKPSKNYTVSFNSPCQPKSEKDRFFETRELNHSDVNHTLNKDKSEVCFKTIWNLELESDCININDTNSCENFTVNIKGYNISIPFKLPPVKIELKHTEKFPVKFQWEHQPSKCQKNLTYSCNASGLADLGALKPFNYYNCTGTYDYGNGTISSDPIIFDTDCNVTNTITSHVTHDRITANWSLHSTDCPEFKLRQIVKCNGSNNIPPEVTCEGDCQISNLKAFNTYTCQFSAYYSDTQITTLSFNKIFKTHSAVPNFKKPELKRLDHNSFQIECEKVDWNGDKGSITANLYIGDDQKKSSSLTDEEIEGKKCLIVFKDLYYLTDYRLKVYAQNGNNNRKEYTLYHRTDYNEKALLGFLSFLIILTSLALLFVLYKIYLLKRDKSRNEQEMDDLLPATTLLQVEPMSGDDLLDAYKKKRADESRLFMEEFQSVPRIFSNFSVRDAKQPENQSKNRYVDILPYDYNRVPLSHGGTDDYINASFIEGYKESNKYIAAQGPKEETIGDFWTMIWEQKSSIIVMVTRCEEGNKNKCAQYWPSMERETEIYDDLVVKIKGQETCPDYIIRHLTLLNRKEKAAEREVTHIQFTSWPDHGVPTDPGLLLKLRRRVNSFKNFFSGPIVIHCSAGVGRTGTYICIDAMIESLEAEGRVDVYGYVVKLRRQRCLMVQVEAQYVLIHTALIEYILFGETEVSLPDFHSEVNTLRQKEGTESSLMDLEFQKLPKFKNYRQANTARTEENKKKNRSSVVPYDFNRVQIKLNDENSHDSEAEEDEEYSSDEDDEVPTKYINASYVDGYWCPNSFIAAQGPLPDTVADFLHMLYQKQVKTVFMLSDCTENDQEYCSQYWDDEKKTFGEMVVEVKETETTPTYIRRCLEIQHTKRKDSHKLQQYHFLKWAGCEFPENPLDLVDMMRNVRKSSNNSNRSQNFPIVVHCNDGSSRTGIFCALWKLLDSADTEKLVDVFQAAKDLRKARTGMINTLEQYEFLYTALEAAYPVQNGEVKKPNEAPADSVQVINESTALISPSTDAATNESSKEGTDSASHVEGATEASNEPEKGPSESTTNGPTATAEIC